MQKDDEVKSAIKAAILHDIYIYMAPPPSIVLKQYMGYSFKSQLNKSFILMGLFPL